MNVLTVLQILLISSFVGGLQFDQENHQKVVHFLQDYVKYEAQSTHLILFTCWDVDRGINLLKSLQVPMRFANFENFTPSYDFGSKHIVYFVSEECSLPFQNFADQHPRVFGHPYRWIIMQKPSANHGLNLSALPDSDVTVAQHLKTGDGFVLEKYYKIDPLSEPIFETYGKWTIDRRLQRYTLEKVPSRRRRNLRGKVLKTTIVISNNNSLHHLDDYKDKHIDSISKVTFVLTKYLFETVNGKMEYNVVGTWGFQNQSTGLWNGMVGELIYKRSDFGGTALFMTQSRLKLIEYLAMGAPTRAKFIFRKPPLSYVTNIYSLPFSGIVWMCSLITVAFSVLIIFVIMKFQAKVSTQQDPPTRISDFILLGITAICQMGSFFNPHSTSARISSLFLFVALLFLYTSYTANIVALLQSTTTSINSLSALLKSQLALGVDDTSYNRQYFATSTELIRKAIYQTKVLTSKGDNFMNITTGISRIRNELFAFNVELGAGYKLIEETFNEHEKCNLMEIEYLQFVDPWFAMQKHSPYKEIMKVNLFKLREFGLQHRECNKIYTKKPLCSANKQSFGSVRLADCYASLVLLFIGFAVSFVIFLGEKSLKNNKLCLW